MEIYKQPGTIEFVNATSKLYVDPETKELTISRYQDGKHLNLVMSDEFNSENRAFSEGKDKMFEALEKPDDSNQAIQFYNSSVEYVTTRNGSLVLITRAVKTSWVEWSSDRLQPEVRTKNYTSGHNTVSLMHR